MATKRVEPAVVDGSAMDRIVGYVPVQLSVQVGYVTMTVSEVSKLGPGTVIRFDAKVGDPVALHANGLLIAHGELLMVDDHYGVRVIELSEPR